MKAIVHRTVAGSSLLVSMLLSACAPNPTVLQDRVYDRYPQQPPVVTPPARPVPEPPVARTLPLPKETAPKVEQRPVANPPKTGTSSTSVVDVTKPNSRPSWETPSTPAWEGYQSGSGKTSSTTPSDSGATTTSPSTTKAYPSSPAVQALSKQADSQMAGGSLDAAASTLERALRIESDNPDLWQKLSKVNAMQGHTEQAASMASKAQAYRELLH